MQRVARFRTPLSLSSLLIWDRRSRRPAQPAPLGAPGEVGPESPTRSPAVRLPAFQPLMCQADQARSPAPSDTPRNSGQSCGGQSDFWPRRVLVRFAVQSGGEGDQGDRADGWTRRLASGRSVYMHVYTEVHACTHMHMHVHTCTCMYTHAHACTHMHARSVHVLCSYGVERNAPHDGWDSPWPGRKRPGPGGGRGLIGEGWDATQALGRRARGGGAWAGPDGRPAGLPSGTTSAQRAPLCAGQGRARPLRVRRLYANAGAGSGPAPRAGAHASSSSATEGSPAGRPSGPGTVRGVGMALRERACARVCREGRGAVAGDVVGRQGGGGRDVVAVMPASWATEAA
jgi:hypothetical protein